MEGKYLIIDYDNDDFLDFTDTMEQARRLASDYIKSQSSEDIDDCDIRIYEYKGNMVAKIKVNLEFEAID